MRKPKLATAEDCRPLFELMNEVKALAPWEWLEETDLFGVKHPQTGEVGFVSIMGMAGEHYAIGFYRGVEGLYGFYRLQDLGMDMQPQDVFYTPQLQASFEDRDTLEKHDYELIKSLGLKYRGRDAWPMFRSYRRGFAPWYIEADEADFLTYILQQVLEVASRAKDNPELLDNTTRGKCLVRVPRKDGDTLVWEDKVMSFEPPPNPKIAIEIDRDLIDMARFLPSGKLTLEADFLMLPTIIGERHERPFFPYLLLIVDTKSGAVFTVRLMQPLPSLEDMWASVGMDVIREFMVKGMRPKEIRVSDRTLYMLLQSIFKHLDIKLKQVNQLPQLDRALASLGNYMGF